MGGKKEEIPYISDLKSLEKFDYLKDKKDGFLSKPKKLTEFLNNISLEIEDENLLVGVDGKNGAIQEKIKKETDSETKMDMQEDLRIHKRYKKELIDLKAQIKSGEEIENKKIDKQFLKDAFSFDTEKMFKNIKISFNELDENIVFKKGSDFEKRKFEVSSFIQVGKDKITIVDQKVFDLIDGKDGIELVESKKYKLTEKKDSIYIEKVENSSNQNEVDEKENNKDKVDEKENNKDKDEKLKVNTKNIIDIDSNKMEVSEELKKRLKQWGVSSIEEGLIEMREFNSDIKKSKNEGFDVLFPGDRYSEFARDLVRYGVPPEDILELINSSFTSEELNSGFEMTTKEKKAFINGMIDGNLNDVEQLENINILTGKSNEQDLVNALMFNYTSNTNEQNTYLFEVLKDNKHNIEFRIDDYDNEFYEKHEDKIKDLYPYLSENQKTRINKKYLNSKF